VTRAAPGTARPELVARGRVQAARRVRLSPNVAGPVVWVSDRLVPGATFEAGEPLARIDERDYLYRVRARRGQVAEARVTLRRQRNRKRVSEREWNRISNAPDASSDADKALALNEPQIDSARAALASARSRLAQAKLDLERTTIRAPFPMKVESESVDVGQRIAPGQALAHIVGTEHAWVKVAVDVDRLPYLAIPGVDGEPEGARATVRYEAGDTTVERQGRVLRLGSGVEDAGNMAQLFVEVPDPYGLTSDHSGPPLLLGTFVEALIRVEPIEEAVELPARALRSGEEIWVMNDDDALERREVELVWRTAEHVWVRGPIERGERIIVSRIGTPVPGMALRQESPGAAKQASASGGHDDGAP
jgi:RND family efflux transporter MFP subunit